MWKKNGKRVNKWKKKEKRKRVNKWKKKEKG